VPELVKLERHAKFPKQTSHTWQEFGKVDPQIISVSMSKMEMFMCVRDFMILRRRIETNHLKGSRPLGQCHALHGRAAAWGE